jgi:tetratricopeptide (TPR) repeat protein
LISEAVQIAKRAVKSSGSSGRAHYNLGRVYDQMGQRREALAEYKKSVDLVPDLAEPHVYLAQLYEKLSDNESAYKEYVIVKRLDQQAARQLADILDILKKTEKK